MTHELSLQRVVEAGTPAQLLKLANVMQNSARQEQVAVYLGVMLRSQLADAHQRDYMLQQATQPGMVKAFGGWGLTEGGCKDWIVKKRAHQRPEGGVGETVDRFNQGRP